MRIVILSLFLALAMCANLRPSHNYWTSKLRDTVKVSDILWGYCDLKCTYLENIFPGNDFVAIRFSSSSIVQPDFTACYVKTGATYKLWSTAVSAGKVPYYDENCGKDTEDYMLSTTGASPKYTVVSKEGEGIGAQITY